MALASRDIQRRLKSVRSVKKITRAMELVAASKMRKSVSRVVQSRAYAESMWQMVMNLIPRTDPKHHALLSQRQVKNVAIVVISSNRGLCGAFNLNVVHAALELVRKEGWEGTRVHFITFGRKGAHILSGLGKTVVADYPKGDITDTIADTIPISGALMKGFLDKKYDEVCLAYTDFRSSLVQKARIRHLLPLVKPSRFLGIIGEKQETNQKLDFSEFLFEPSPDIVLEALLVRLIEVQVYQAVLESEASEHSARMMAMHNATDAASDMLDALTLAYNQARQASITAELAEITAATVAQ